jgi:hypothetical protein
VRLSIAHTLRGAEQEMHQPGVTLGDGDQSELGAGPGEPSGLGQPNGGCGGGQTGDGRAGRGAGKAGRAADPAACGAAEDWLGTAREREVLEKEPKIEI